MENSRASRAAPTSANVTVGRRSREYLTEREVERLIEAAKQNRSGHRDATAILVAYCHGLRASELVALRWDDIDLTTGRLHVRRAKSGDASVHPISARESRALRKLLREAPTSPYVFISERRAPLSAAGYQRMVARAGRGCEIHLSRSFPHAATCLRVQARQRRPRHSRHPSLSRAPLYHVHSSLYCFDAQSVQEFLERLTFPLSRSRSSPRPHLVGAFFKPDFRSGNIATTPSRGVVSPPFLVRSHRARQSIDFT
jgi:integrase